MSSSLTRLCYKQTYQPVVMSRPQLQIRILDGDSVHGCCTECPFPKVSFVVAKTGTYKEVVSELLRLFKEHLETTHSV